MPCPVEVSVHPAFTAIRTVQSVIEPEGIPVALGAQNCAEHEAGAFTGEVSAAMLAKLHVAYVIVGHSERRRIFGETDEQVLAKVLCVLRNGMTPICCVGETEDERERGLTEDRLAEQVRSAVSTLGSEAVSRMVIAYEPVWAIGTGRAATSDDAQAACRWIREVVADCVGPDAAARDQGPVRRLRQRGEHRVPPALPRRGRRAGRRGEPRGRRPSPPSSGPRPWRRSDFGSVRAGSGPRRLTAC